MFRDTKQELQRLEQELLQEESAQEPEFGEEPSGEYEGDYVNFASGYRAYNSDRADVELEEYGRTVREGEKSRLTGLIVLALLLSAGIVCILGYWFLRLLGVWG